MTDGSVALHLDEADVADVDAELDDEDYHWELLELEPNERAALGIFLGFQYPAEIEGVTLVNFLRTALNAKLEERDDLLFGEYEEADEDESEHEEEEEEYEDYE